MLKILKISLISTRNYTKKLALPLRSTKPKSIEPKVQNFIDSKPVRAIAGKGGDGCVSFLHLWANEKAGPDGGDGGNGAHVVFRASSNVTDLNRVSAVLKGSDGEKGRNKDCCGKNAEHTIIEVPLGTILRDENGKVVADLSEIGAIFVAARGGAGGKGNRFFITDVEQSPKICEFGALGEDVRYNLEVRSIAQIGFIGFPNAGKSTLLRAISRARPKVAPYPFTTLKPHIGVVQYEDYEQVVVADLPGLIPDSHKNKGLGMQFLKHVERCIGFLYVLDMSEESPWEHLETLRFELKQFNEGFEVRPQFVVANKMDLPEAEEKLEMLRRKTDLEVIALSAKKGYNLLGLLNKIRCVYDADNSNNNNNKCSNKKNI